MFYLLGAQSAIRGMADLLQSQGRSVSCFAEHGKRIHLGKFENALSNLDLII